MGLAESTFKTVVAPIKPATHLSRRPILDRESDASYPITSRCFRKFVLTHATIKEPFCSPLRSPSPLLSVTHPLSPVEGQNCSCLSFLFLWGSVLCLQCERLVESLIIIDFKNRKIKDFVVELSNYFNPHIEVFTFLF